MIFVLEGLNELIVCRITHLTVGEYYSVCVMLAVFCLLVIRVSDLYRINQVYSSDTLIY